MSTFEIICFIIMITNAFLSAVSQILLKKSAMVKHKSPLYEYLNWRVVCAYGIFFLVLLTNAYAYQVIDYKLGPIIGTTTYLFVMLLSMFILKEKITERIFLGNMIIILGIIIYTL